MVDTTIFHETSPRVRAPTVGFTMPPGLLEAAIVIGGSVGFAAAGAILGAFLMLPFGG